MNKHVAKKPIALKVGVVTGALAILLSALTPLVANAAAPTLSSVSPVAGSAAGGTSITITGSGFTGVACPGGVKVGTVDVASCTVTNDTTITATLPARTGTAKTIGPREIEVTNGADTSAAGSLRYTYVPIVDNSKTNENQVILGNLASRSQRKLVTRSSSSPFQVNGTDSLSGLPYSYITNYAYNSASHLDAYSREADQPGFHTGAGTAVLGTKSVTATNYGGRSVRYLKSDGDCNTGGRPNDNRFNSGDGNGLITTYCSVFGPEIYSEAFYATDAQALAFEWKALGITDDYSVYGYLVEVADDSNLPTPSTSNTKLVMHGVGSKTVSAPANAADGWTTSTANVPSTGRYRFRFVNGSFDGTGGQAIGADFYISSVFMAGDRNDITLTSPGDKLTTTGPWTTTASATSGQTVEVTSLTPSVCTVTYTGAPTTTATITQVSTGTCTLQGAQGATGNYAPAATVITSFAIRTSAVPPEAPTITSVTPGNQQLTVNFAAPNRDGGAAITKYQYQVDGGAWVDLPSTPGPFTITGLTNGTTYQIKVRAVSSAGNGTSSGQSPGTPANVLTITSANTKSGAVGTALTHTLTGSGGTSPYTWSTNTLPAGLSLSAGVISGTPTTAATTSVTVTITDSASGTTTQTLTITISSNNPAITSANTLSGTNGTSLTHSLTGSGGTSPYTWTASTLPSGLTLTGSTISGTPTTSGTFTITITITDAASGTNTQTLTITIATAGGGGGSNGNSPSPSPSATPPPAKRPPVTITIGGFKPGSPVLTKQIQAKIKSFIAKNPDYKNVIATGVTDGPTVLKVDKNLSKTRATNALSFLTKTLKAPVKVAQVKAKQETRKGSAVRRIVLTLTD